MAPPPTSKQQEALEFLNDLDSFSAPPPPASSAGTTSAAANAHAGTTPPGDTAEVLAFLDEITQKSSEPLKAKISRPGSRAATERVTLSGTRSHNESPRPTSSGATASSNANSPSAESTAGPAGGSGWGWGSVWSTASAAIQQAKTAVDEGVKNLPNVPVPKNEQAKKWSAGVMEYVKNAQLDKIGQDITRSGLSALTDILNAVAPPIAEHEVIQVWLSHDMEGYDGVETLVYRALSRMLEQVEGGDLVVNKGNESRPKDQSKSGRELNPVEGFEPAYKLALANVEELIKSNSDKKPENTTAESKLRNPTTYSSVYLRIQPYTSPSPFPSSSTSPPSSQLQFLLHLSDPAHSLECSTTTQSVPSQWLELWDDKGNGDWVEDSLAEALRVGVEILGQEYLVKRMGWGKQNEEDDMVTVVKEEDITAAGNTRV